MKNIYKIENNSKLIRIFFSLLFWLFSGINMLYAQREYLTCDSTFYSLNSETTIVAGRNKIYSLNSGNLIELHDFTTNDADEFIRDFDIVSPLLWYAVVGSRYIGGPTQLYKSTNGGVEWGLDTAHYAANNAQTVDQIFLGSINNLQHLGGDTLIMFMHYYDSGIIYSTDLGQTWTLWFHNLITHYQGMFECENTYAIYGYEGDAFRAWMFEFEKNLLFSSGENGEWNSFSINSNHPRCSLSNDTVNCVYSNSNLSRCETYQYFKSYIEENCHSVGFPKEENIEFVISPNPFRERMRIQPKRANATYRLLNVFGTTVWEGKDPESGNFDWLPSGVYWLNCTTGTISLNKMVVKSVMEP